MMSQPAVSIIIPVYNQEKYVGKCIRSVLGQSFLDFEVIIVNDGSTDRSLEICLKYAKSDNRITVIDKKNEGVAFARRDGFLKAIGEYVCFLDSDDYLDENALEVLYGIASEKKTDVVVGSYDIVFDDWGLLKKKVVPFRYIDTEIPKEHILPGIIGINGLIEDQWGGYVWGRLYKHSSVLKAWEKSENLMFPFYTKSGSIEDVAFNLALASFIESIWVSSIVVLHYRYGGITSRDFPCIRLGASCFDDRVEFCIHYHCESVLPRILNHYSLLLRHDAVCQIHFGAYPQSEIRRFIQEEFARRNIVLWAQDNALLLHDEMKKIPLIRCVVNNDVDGFLYEVKNYEKFLKKHHYWKSKILTCYQKMADAISWMFVYHR